ncbi:MAG: hypothetical protein OEV21_00330 [Thermoplasmata archaeon]|nr:hypothetical protein [Thermoplasmata archaeon]
MPGKSAMIAVIALAVMMFVTPAIAAADDIVQDRDLSVDVLTGTTTRMGGGDWIAVKAGDVIYGVIYGTEENPNEIIILTEQRRYIGGADVYGENGELLRMQGIPINLVYAAKLVSIVEFIDKDNDSLFDLRWLSNTTGLADKPVKTASLTIPWAMENLDVSNGENVTTVDFDLTAKNVSYTWVWPMAALFQMPRKAIPADGVVDQITFSIHLRFEREMKTVEMVPWFNITVSDGQVKNHTFAGYRNYTADVLNGSIKYDHYISGWDFASNESKLAVEMGLIAGIHAQGAVAEQLRARIYSMRCEMNGTPVANDNGNGPVAPVLARDTLRFQDTWERFGNLSWVNTVEVDGVEKEMVFQVQNGGTFGFTSNGHLYAGFMVRTAFIYPAGDEIFHDPLFQSTATTLTISESTNPFAKILVIGQLIAVIVGIALAIALGIFLKKKNEKVKSTGKVSHNIPWQPSKPVHPQQPGNSPMQPPYPPRQGGKEQ